MNDFVEVQQIIRIVRRWWWVLFVTTLLAILLGYTFSVQQTEIFRATTGVFVGPTVQSTGLESYDFDTSKELANMYADFGLRQPVLQAVIDELELDQSWRTLRDQVSVTPVEGSQLLEISVETPSPEEAIEIADEIARQLILLNPASVGNQTDEDTDEFVQQRLERLQTNIEAAQLRIDMLEGYLSDYVGVSLEQLRELQGEIETLETLIATWESTYASLYRSFRGESSRSLLAVFEPAQANPDPVRPRIELNLLIAAIVGFGLGLGFVVLLEYGDNTLRSADEVTAMLKMPSLGAISRIPGSRTEDMMVVNQDMFSSMAEDFRLLRSKLLFLSKAWPRKVFLITSPAQAEGKSIVVANLGIAMANIGLKVVIVDANLRNPNQHVLFNLTQENGLAEEIHSSQSQLPQRLKKSRVENLYILTSGSMSLASPDRLATARMTELFARLAEQVDIILCDAPEAVAFADTPELADKANGVLLVIDAGHTRRENARQAVHDLRQTGANLLGFVLNRASWQARTASLTYRRASLSVGAVVDEQAAAELR